jgi:DNA mismatch repair protein MutL
MLSTTPPPRRPIRVLPATVAGRIAAGEVIERPASVVKELVENALDASARHIRVDVSGGGLILIRVSDDGIGIPSDQLYLACQRHATSKLATDDLSQVQTLGFRGEALPSIAAVAELTLVSATDESGIGRRLTLRDGHVVVDEPAPRPCGTTVTVRHLFQNVPARLAAAGRPQTEIAQIAQVVRRLALAAPQVRLALFVDGRRIVQTTGSGDVATTLAEVYGSTLAASLIPVGPLEVAGARLWGAVSGSEVTRPGRGQINVIVNGRWTQPRALLTLLEAGYRPVLPRGRHPVLALVVEIAPDQVDINIHPAKLEVRLLNERAIGAAAGELVHTALAHRPLPLSQHALQYDGVLSSMAPPHMVAEPSAAHDEEEPIVTPGLPPLRLVGQGRARLLLLEGPTGLYLIDQHRAHERILYEQLMATYNGLGPEPIALAEPLVIELQPAQVAHFSRQLDDLIALGFHVESFGGRTFLLRAAPPLLGVLHHTEQRGSDPVIGNALDGLGQAEELIATLLTLTEEEAGEGWQERLLVRLACRTAVRRGRPLGRSAMRALVERLGQTSAPAVCPHGSPLLIHVSETLLERQFGWR